MRGRAALASALPQDSMSAGTARDRAQIVGPLISCAIFRTASKSSGDDAGKPASIISTFNRASWRASVILSRLPRRVPAACSPSLRVVSNTAIFDVPFIPASSMNVLDLLSGQNSRTPLAYRKKAFENKQHPENLEIFRGLRRLSGRDPSF